MSKIFDNYIIVLARGKVPGFVNCIEVGNCNFSKLNFFLEQLFEESLYNKYNYLIIICLHEGPFWNSKVAPGHLFSDIRNTCPVHLSRLFWMTVSIDRPCSP